MVVFTVHSPLPFIGNIATSVFFVVVMYYCKYMFRATSVLLFHFFLLYSSFETIIVEDEIPVVLSDDEDETPAENIKGQESLR